MVSWEFHHGRAAKVLSGLALIVLALLSAVAPAPAGAAFAVTGFAGSATNPDGSRNALAGGHPDLRTRIDFATQEVEGVFQTDGNVRTVEVDLPPGLVGNPTGVPTCQMDLLRGAGFFTIPRCPAESQVGMANVESTLGFPFVYPSGVYNMEAPVGSPAVLGFQVLGVPVLLEPKLRGGDYGLTVVASENSQTLAIASTDLTIWGVPASPVHDAERLRYDPENEFELIPNTPSHLAETAFLTAPTNCAAGPLTTTLRADSWQNPGSWQVRSFDHDMSGEPMQVEGCDEVPFNPSLAVRTGNGAPGAPTGLSVKLSFPQEGVTDPKLRATGHLKKASVTLPEGMTVNPASAGGLQACTDAQLGLGNTDPVSCPLGAKIGSAQATTPLLEESLTGGVYLRPQASRDPESGQMFRLALVLENEERGIRVKLPGSVKADKATGRLVATFDDNPQLPVSTVQLDLKDGPRAPLVNPTTCGPQTVEAELSAWSGQTVTRKSTFNVTCGSAAFKPTLEAGTANPLAGAFSPFVASIAKPEGAADLSNLKLELPPGLLASLKGNLGTQVGTVNALAGPGSSPFALPGKVYLDGAYKGAPYSLRVVVPAKAGPFDLGEVTVRAAVQVDPTTAQVTAVSDPLPQIVAGVPPHLQRLDVSIDKPQFTLNPTSCDPMEVKGTIGSAAGTEAKVADRFQVASCERLSFKPNLKLSVKGPTHRNAFPALKAVLSMPKQNGANIQRAQVTLPKSELLEQAHIRTICTRVQYAAGPGGGAGCPAASIYGKAKAWSPLLDEPLEGPVYLRSSSHKLPDLVASLDGQIHIDLVGRIDAVNARIRNTFEGVPDAPVSRFVLEMQGGKKGLLANNTELCKATPRASVKFDGQNGKVADWSPVMRADCGKARKKK